MSKLESPEQLEKMYTAIEENINPGRNFIIITLPKVLTKFNPNDPDMLMATDMEDRENIKNALQQQLFSISVGLTQEVDMNNEMKEFTPKPSQTVPVVKSTPKPGDN